MQGISALAYGSEEVDTRTRAEDRAAARIAQRQDPTAVRVVLERVGRRLDDADARFVVSRNGEEAGILAGTDRRFGSMNDRAGLIRFREPIDRNDPPRERCELD